MAKKLYSEICAPRLGEIGKWRRDGAKYEWIAQKLGVGKTLFGQWRKQNAELAEALKEAEGGLRKDLLLCAEDTLFEKLRDRMKVVEITTEKRKNKAGVVIGTRVTERKKLVLADTTAIIFALRAGNPEKWDVEHEMTKARVEKVKAETQRIGSGDDVRLLVERMGNYGKSE